MIYDYVCVGVGCSNIQEESHSVNGFKEFRPKCVKCGKDCKYKFSPSVSHVILKDGPTGSWPSKGERFKKYRQEASENASRRQKDRYGHMSRDAIPNVGGKETGTWAEAREVARKERGEESARTYNGKVRDESKTST